MTTLINIGLTVYSNPILSGAGIFRPSRAWNDGKNCGGGNAYTNVVVQFTEDVFFGADLTGLLGVNIVSGVNVFTPVSANGEGTKFIDYAGTWSPAVPDAGDEILFGYSKAVTRFEFIGDGSIDVPLGVLDTSIPGRISWIQSRDYTVDNFDVLGSDDAQNFIRSRGTANKDWRITAGGVGDNFLRESLQGSIEQECDAVWDGAGETTLTINGDSQTLTLGAALSAAGMQLCNRVGGSGFVGYVRDVKQYNTNQVTVDHQWNIDDGVVSITDTGKVGGHDGTLNPGEGLWASDGGLYENSDGDPMESTNITVVNCKTPTANVVPVAGYTAGENCYLPAGVKFNGFDNLLKRPISPQVAPSQENNEGRFSFWLKPVKGVGGNEKIIDLGAPASAAVAESVRVVLLFATPDPDNIRFVLSHYNDPGWTIIADENVLSDENGGLWTYDVWNHFLLTYKNDTIDGTSRIVLSVNGQVAADAPYVPGQEDQTVSFVLGDQIVIGSRHNEGANYYNGSMAEFWAHDSYRDPATDVLNFIDTSNTARTGWPKGIPIDHGVDGIVDGVEPNTFMGGNGYDSDDWNTGLDRGFAGDFIREGPDFVEDNN